QPGGDHLVIVKVLTSEPGLYGLGCATHKERPLAVASAVNDYLKPFVVGKNPEDIEDIWQSAYVSSYFRQGVTLNNAISGVDCVHDVHERVSPTQALALAKAVEPFRLFFLEDAMAPEDVAWFQIMRQQTSTPLAMGELFVNRNEWLPLVANRWIDFIRCHISAVGGLNMARKVAACCEFFHVRTAWHGPGNVSPVGHAVNMHLDLSTSNFGI